MVTSNRSINTGFDPKKQTITLETLQSGEYNGKKFAAGETIEVSRSEAKRLITQNKQLFKIHMA